MKKISGIGTLESKKVTNVLLQYIENFHGEADLSLSFPNDSNYKIP